MVQANNFSVATREGICMSFVTHFIHPVLATARALRMGRWEARASASGRSPQALNKTALMWGDSEQGNDLAKETEQTNQKKKKKNKKGKKTKKEEESWLGWDGEGGGGNLPQPCCFFLASRPCSTKALHCKLSKLSEMLAGPGLLKTLKTRATSDRAAHLGQQLGEGHHSKQGASMARFNFRNPGHP